VKAVEPVTAMVITADDFRAFLLDHPSVAVAMLEGVLDRLREVQERVDAWMA
jgi:CRP-like cAMP-binding protein